MNVRVMTDSGSGLTKAQAEALGMDYLPLQVTAGDSTYLDGIDLTTDRLYDMLEAGDMPSTSLPPLGIVEELAEKYEEEGVTDVVLITLSNGLSSTNSTVTERPHPGSLHHPGRGVVCGPGRGTAGSRRCGSPGNRDAHRRSH